MTCVWVAIKCDCGCNSWFLPAVSIIHTYMLSNTTRRVLSTINSQARQFEQDIRSQTACSPPHIPHVLSKTHTFRRHSVVSWHRVSVCAFAHVCVRVYYSQHTPTFSHMLALAYVDTIAPQIEQFIHREDNTRAHTRLFSHSRDGTQTRRLSRCEPVFHVRATVLYLSFSYASAGFSSFLVRLQFALFCLTMQLYKKKTR